MVTSPLGFPTSHPSCPSGHTPGTRPCGLTGCLQQVSSPGQHSCVGITGVALLPALPHGRGEVLPHSDKVLHRVEGQLNVISLQTHQVIWLQNEEIVLMSSREKRLYWGKKIRGERLKGKPTNGRVSKSKAPCPTPRVAPTMPLGFSGTYGQSPKPRHPYHPTGAKLGLLPSHPSHPVCRADPASFILEGPSGTHQVQILFGDSLYFSNFTLKLLGEKR